jgi:hypothetical protein
MTHAGLLSHNSPFSDWNAAAFGYCDGSAFLGIRQKATLVGGKPYLFKGQHNLLTYLEWLQEEHGLQEVREVVVMGFGYGALATLLHLPLLRQWLPESVRMSAVVEAPMYLHVPELKHGQEESRRMRMALDAWNASGSLVPECVAKHSQEPWLCFFPEYFGQWLPPNVPLMVAQRRLEPFALKLYAGLGPKQEVSEDVRAALVPRVKASLEAVRPSGVIRLCGDASILTSAQCNEVRVEGKATPCGLVSQWYANEGRTPMVLEEECT